MIRMPQAISNEQDLRKIMQKAVNDVILVVSERLLIKLKEQIKQEIYGKADKSRSRKVLRKTSR